MFYDPYDEETQVKPDEYKDDYWFVTVWIVILIVAAIWGVTQ